jgi:hypothetical protein
VSRASEGERIVADPVDVFAIEDFSVDAAAGTVIVLASYKPDRDPKTRQLLQ